jgi:hypothetical protein
MRATRWIIILFLLAISHSELLGMSKFVDPAEKVYYGYSCKREEDAIACNTNCERLSDTKVSFKIVKDTSKLYIKFEETNGRVSIAEYEECKIFDDKDWYCISSYPASTNMNKGDTAYHMSNGKIYGYMTGVERYYICNK